MRTTYLDNYEKEKIVYLPVGTFEWHGYHLPLETDVIVAETFCEKLSKEIPGYVMPGIYLGTDKSENALRGMERHAGMHHLPGEIYFLKPELLKEMLCTVIDNLLQDFEKVILITGHGGSKQIETLEVIQSENNKVIFESPYKALNDIRVEHADENEASTLWACRPEEEKKSREATLKENDDYVKFLGYDPREKASIELGQKLLNEMLDSLKTRIKSRLEE